MSFTKFMQQKYAIAAVVA